MAIIRKGLPNNKRGNYTKYDNKVFLINGLSDGAKVLYGYISSMMNGRDFSDTFFMKGLQLSEKTLYRRKKELIDSGLIYVDRVGPKQYIMYVGYTDVSALAVKQNWNYIERKDNEGISLEELQERTKQEMKALRNEVVTNQNEVVTNHKEEDDELPFGYDTIEKENECQTHYQ